MEVLREAILEPSAWTSSELAADSSWIHHLPDDEMAELETAVETVMRQGFAPYRFSKHDFALPTLGKRLERCTHELEHGRGCVLLRGLNVDRYDMESLKYLYWGLGVHLGQPMSQNAKGQLIGHVTNTGKDYYSNNVRGYTTRAALRPHCDPTDIVSLLCVHQAKSGGESLIASAMTIYNEILKSYPEYLETLCRGYYFDLRGEGATGEPNEVTRHRVPVFSYFEGRLSCRFNRKTIEDGQVKAGQPLSQFDLDAMRCVSELAMRDDVRFDMAFEAGDIQLLNNHLVLHARNTFEDNPEPHRKRNLLRLWLNLENGRPLAPAFAERLNTGPRGGVAIKGINY